MSIVEAKWIWHDGEFVAWHDARVHVLSLAVQFGSSVFEGIRCYETPHRDLAFPFRVSIRGVTALHVRHDRLPFETGIVTHALVPSSRTLSDVVGVAVQPNKAIVGANAFAHEAGIHQDGVLKNPLTYEIMRPATVGATGSRIVIGKHSGKRGLDARCRELGHHLRGEALDRVYQRLMDVADTGRAIDDSAIHEALHIEASHPLVNAPGSHASAIGHEGVA